MYNNDTEVAKFPGRGGYNSTCFVDLLEVFLYFLVFIWPPRRCAGAVTRQYSTGILPTHPDAQVQAQDQAL